MIWWQRLKEDRFCSSLRTANCCHVFLIFWSSLLSNFHCLVLHWAPEELIWTEQQEQWSWMEVSFESSFMRVSHVCSFGKTALNCQLTSEKHFHIRHRLWRNRKTAALPLCVRLRQGTSAQKAFFRQKTSSQSMKWNRVIKFAPPSQRLVRSAGPEIQLL